MDGTVITHTKNLACLDKHMKDCFIKISQSVIVKEHIRKINRPTKTIVLVDGQELSFTTTIAAICKSLQKGRL
jgi:hypothetical protein